MKYTGEKSPAQPKGGKDYEKSNVQIKQRGQTMKTTEVQRKANAKYQAKFDDIKIRVPKGNREKYKTFAKNQGKSLNALIIELLDKKMSRD